MKVKTIMSKGRQAFLNFIFLGPFLAFVAIAASPQPYLGFKGKLPSDSNELIWGEASALVTVVEYTALTCGHCAEFHRTVLPEIRKKYIDTGRVRFIFRHFPIDRLSLKAATLVNALPFLKRSYVIDQIFHQQEHWIQSGDKAIEKLAFICQLPLEECHKVTNDQKKMDATLQSRLNIEKIVTIEGTPTFFIDDKMYPTTLSLAEFDEIISPKLQNVPKHEAGQKS